MKILNRLAERNRTLGAHRPILIACLGDSVTHGCFELEAISTQQIAPYYRAWDAYSMKLQRRLSEIYPMAMPTVLNAGVAGENIAMISARAERDVLSFHPDLVILEICLNDAGSGLGDPLKSFAEKAGELMDKILASGAELILLTPNSMCYHVPKQAPKTDNWPEFYKNVAEVQSGGVMSAYVQAARDEANKRNVPIADAYARWELMEKQGVDTTSLLANRVNHPVPEMHDLFVEEIIRTMQLSD